MQEVNIYRTNANSHHANAKEACETLPEFIFLLEIKVPIQKKVVNDSDGHRNSRSNSCWNMSIIKQNKKDDIVEGCTGSTDEDVEKKLFKGLLCEDFFDCVHDEDYTIRSALCEAF